MASTDPGAVLQRLLEDDFIHERIAEASANARGAYRRLRRLPPEKAIADQALFDRVRDAVGSVIAAGRAALGEPEPEPKRGSRVLAAMVLAATGAIVVWAAKQDGRAQTAVPAPVAPVAPG
jgi:hypothetical protein